MNTTYQWKYNHGGYSGVFDTFPSDEHMKGRDILIVTHGAGDAATELGDLRSKVQQLRVIMDIGQNDLQIARRNARVAFDALETLRKEIVELRNAARADRDSINFLDELDRLVAEYTDEDEDEDHG